MHDIITQKYLLFVNKWKYHISSINISHKGFYSSEDRRNWVDNLQTLEFASKLVGNIRDTTYLTSLV